MTIEQLSDSSYQVLKRDGRTESLNADKIYTAIFKCFNACGVDSSSEEVNSIVAKVVNKINNTPTHVEDIQDIVEQTLIETGYVEAARKYMRYRDYKNSIRERKPLNSEDKDKIVSNRAFFKNDLAEFVYFSRYARWRDDLGRREVWEESVDRLVDYYIKRTEAKLPSNYYEEVRQAIKSMEVLPSMRAMAMAGPATDKTDLSIYNCSFINIDSIDSLVELLYVLMAGCGAGYSVELYYCTDKVPRVRMQKKEAPQTFVIPDTTEGWADAFKLGLESWFSGKDVVFDYSQIRPAGSKLKTKGGYASGPEPLKNLLDFSREVILSHQGQKLSPIDLHDIACMVGYVVVSGGVRRCLPKGTKVETNNGTKLIEDIQVGDLVLTGEGSYKPVVNKFDQGMQYVLHFLLEEGMVFSCTGNHRLAVSSDNGYTWVRARDLKNEYDVNGTCVKYLVSVEKTDTGTILSPVGIVNIIDSLDYHQTYDLEVQDDHCFVANGVLVHNSAEISLSDLFDTEMRYAKDGQFWTKHPYRSMSNNSAVYEERPTAVEFMEEWLSLAKSGSGERGIFNRQAAIKCRPKRRKSARFGTNPSLRAGTLVRTKNGIYPIESLEGRTFEVPNLNGQWSEAECFLSGNKQLYEVKLNNGRSYFCTAEHKWPVVGLDKVTTTELKPGMKLPTLKFTEISSDKPSSKNNLHGTYNEGFASGIYYKLRGVPKGIYTDLSEDFRKGFVSGAFNLLGRVSTEGLSIVADSDKIDDIQNLLGFYGVLTVSSSHPDKEQFKVLTVQNPSHFLSCFTVRNEELLEDIKKLKDNDFSIEVVEVVPTDLVEDVWDISVYDDTHCFQLAYSMTGNCGEIILRSKELCNLSEVVARPDDTRETLLEKVRLATIIGTIQATFTNFPYLSPEWKQNCEEERLLGVSITGQMDCPLLNVLIKDPNNKEALELVKELKQQAIKTNEEVADMLGINHSAAITCCKPSGTVSQLADTASGVHPRFAKYYIRRVRINAKDPLYQLAKDCGISCYPEVGETAENCSTWVLEFPVKAPEGCITRHDVSAIDQLEYWLRLKNTWAEHSISCTVYVDDDEWLDVGNWVYNHFDSITGLSFLPKNDHIYQLAPYEEISEEQYLQMVSKTVSMEYYKLYRYEKEDTTGLIREYACTGDKCEIL